MAFDAYLQRADDYITKQIQKFEQQKRGNRSPPRANGYHQMHQSRQHDRMSSQGGYSGSPAPLSDQHHSPPGSILPAGWIQNYDSQSQRWYYVDTTTGRSQRNPPSSGPLRAATFQPDTRMPSPYNQYTRHDEANLRTRSNSQPQRPEMNEGGQFLDPRQNGNAGPSPSVTSMQLPPGAHYNTRTGKIVHSMLPEGQTVQSWSQEIQRI